MRRITEEHGSQLSEADLQLTAMIDELLNESRFQEAHALASNRLGEVMALPQDRAGLILASLLSGQLVDIGGEGRVELAVSQGLACMESLLEDANRLFGEATCHYCLGNAKHSLYNLRRTADSAVYTPESIQLLTEAKDHFWKAYRLAPSGGRSAELLINTANALDESGRTIEALSLYDAALHLVPRHAMGHLNRSMALQWLVNVGGVSSVSLLYRMRDGFNLAARQADLPLHLRDDASRRMRALNEHLLERAEPLDQSEAHVERKLMEAESHTRFRKYCLREGLALSEHALYCCCAGSRRDDLAIATAAFPLRGQFIGRMELVLNRLKAEFGFSRALYYQIAQAAEDEEWKTESFEPTYLELGDDEVISLKSEMLRTAFRGCFGVLDKIARAVCDLYELAEPQEAIYFTSFWKTRSKHGKAKTRWAEINARATPPLVALYSQATDLNLGRGEFGRYKEWRNAVEHDFLHLVSPGASSLGPMLALAPGREPKLVSVSDFAMGTLHLLRLTAAAIFHFAHLVRLEGRRNQAQCAAELAIELRPKAGLGPD